MCRVVSCLLLSPGFRGSPSLVCFLSEPGPTFSCCCCCGASEASAAGLGPGKENNNKNKNRDVETDDDDVGEKCFRTREKRERERENEGEQKRHRHPENTYRNHMLVGTGLVGVAWRTDGNFGTTGNKWMFLVRCSCCLLGGNLSLLVGKLEKFLRLLLGW